MGEPSFPGWGQMGEPSSHAWRTIGNNTGGSGSNRSLLPQPRGRAPGTTPPRRARRPRRRRRSEPMERRRTQGRAGARGGGRRGQRPLPPQERAKRSERGRGANTPAPGGGGSPPRNPTHSRGRQQPAAHSPRAHPGEPLQPAAGRQRTTGRTGPRPRPGDGECLGKAPARGLFTPRDPGVGLKPVYQGPANM